MAKVPDESGSLSLAASKSGEVLTPSEAKESHRNGLVLSLSGGSVLKCHCWKII